MNTENLNPEQAKAVNTINGPVLIIAGALLSSCTSVYNCSTTSFLRSKKRRFCLEPATSVLRLHVRPVHCLTASLLHKLASVLFLAHPWAF